METTSPCCRFQKGDKVKFIDKYGQLVRGTFEQYDALPAASQGAHVSQVQGYIVIAQPFGPEHGDVRCFVIAGELERDA